MKWKTFSTVADSPLGKAEERTALRTCRNGLKNVEKALKTCWHARWQIPRAKLDFFIRHSNKLPLNVFMLILESSPMERKALINSILVKTKRNEFCFQLDAPYLRDSHRAEFVCCSPMSAWACIHWHQRTPNHINPPSHKTSGIVAGT